MATQYQAGYVFKDDGDILNNVDYFVREALNYKDHSKLGGGI